MALIEIRNVTKVYDMGAEKVHALNGVDLEIERGEYIAIMGSSGSGKSTLMNLLGCLDTPTSGLYRLNGVEVQGLGDQELAAIRNKEIGFVFQTFNLLARTDALHNVELPLIYAGEGRQERRDKAMRALEKVRLGDRTHHQPNELSGGQRQRVAIAAALVLEPDGLICDEPVSMLDASVRSQILAVLVDLQRRRDLALVFITHDLSLAWSLCDRIAVMYLGRVVEQGMAVDVIERPKHPYTQALVTAIPVPSAGGGGERELLKGELPDAAAVPSGCRFHPRCPRRFEPCDRVDPELVPAGSADQIAACLLYDPTRGRNGAAATDG
jgi:oligopeptide/dipeptide ABC transporter ATP-binding protein